jgi:hypothetical protein
MATPALRIYRQCGAFRVQATPPIPADTPDPAVAGSSRATIPGTRSPVPVGSPAASWAPVKVVGNGAMERRRDFNGPGAMTMKPFREEGRPWTTGPPSTKRVWRSGVRFDCPECGKLLKDDVKHAETMAGGCASCGGDLRLVGRGERMVEGALWFRCLSCDQLYMKRRGEVVETRPRSGFEEFTRF